MNKACGETARRDGTQQACAPDVSRPDRAGGAVVRALRFPGVARHQLRAARLRERWLKVHRAPEFYAALLNNQPMGFYSPATLIKDAQRHGLRFLPGRVCASRSGDARSRRTAAIRLGLAMVKGLQREHGGAARSRNGRSASVEDFQSAGALAKEEWRTLAEIGALQRARNASAGRAVGGRG